MRSIIISLLAMLLANVVHANHLIGAEIRYTHVSGFTYSIEGVLQTHLCAPADRPEILISVNGTTDTIPRTSMIDILELGCCGTRISGYQFEHTFAGNGIHTIELIDLNRDGGIVNMTASIQTPICVTATLYISPTSGHNNSIHFNTPMTELDQSWNVFSHDPGAFDLDGDSLSFELIVPMGAACSPVPGYNFPEAANFIWIDPDNGTWIWDHPIAQGRYTFAIRGTEWRNGEIVGEVIRDMMVCLVPFDVGFTDRLDLSTFTISPTLTDGLIRISNSSSAPLQMTILSTTGAVIMAMDLPPGEQSVDLGGYADGVYLIRLIDSSGATQATRIVKQ